MTDYVYAEFLHLLEKRVATHHGMMGSLEDGRLRMPYDATDGRRLTWQKTIKSLSRSIINNPSSREDCWYVAPNHSSSGTQPKTLHITKLGRDGSSGKWITARLTFVMFWYHAIMKPLKQEVQIL
eukprot:CAMPEP_0185830008 /NCGR_PEP_ID=MMETSP1353-20130828/577_1 /TAXON_ID=1077150 /ORGANISM="Erythrolobus australicus, Strain CCMP3124" /LENGTH=124 /DNA_ID=CAMNT_0028527859 /DNA_START=948 /DNA_END=1322 /DNA_ORIENTATION=+